MDDTERIADVAGATLRVMLWMPLGSRVPGGHVVQLEQTAAALTRAGVHVTTHLDPDPSSGPDDIDLVHGFGLGADDIRHFRARGVPVVVSSIYWERAYRVDWAPTKMTARVLLSRIARTVRFARVASGRTSALVEACIRVVSREFYQTASFESADLLLPNADGEGDAIRRDLQISTPIITVPNGVDPGRFSPNDSSLESRKKVLYVGRVEPHKNQLGLINALRGSGFPLVIAGYEHPDHRDYAASCRKAGKGWVEFVGPFSEDEAADLYGTARVHVLPSWFETTGLVSLEAALCGCNIVTTSRGYAHEYLGDLVWYCDPGRPSSILEAVRSAWDGPRRPELRDRILSRYTWDHVAARTIAAYQTALSFSHPEHA